jgi:hypothetical protein
MRPSYERGWNCNRCRPGALKLIADPVRGRLVLVLVDATDRIGHVETGQLETLG